MSVTAPPMPAKIPKRSSVSRVLAWCAAVCGAGCARSASVDATVADAGPAPADDGGSRIEAEAGGSLLVDGVAAEASAADGSGADGSSPRPRSQIWIVYDSGAVAADLDGMMDCLVNQTSFDAIIASFDASPWGGLQVQWSPQGGSNGHGGSTVSAAPGACGQLYAPDAQCLTDLVMNDPGLGAPADGDVFLYVVHDGATQCGGGNNAGVTGGAGEAVQGPHGTIYVYTATIADGWGYLPCQERVAMHELFESVTQVDAADCCTGQTPGNLGPDCSYACASNTGVGPAGYGSYTLACPGGKTYTGQQVEKWSSAAYVNGVWQPAGCTAAQ
jgi:hypothetical protein